MMPIFILNSVAELKAYRKSLQAKTIGFVPTMGCLHAGHASLIKRSVDENEVTILSIYVNPTQFNNQNDLQHYPKTFDQDLEMAKSFGVDAIFYPSDPKALYPDDYCFKVEANLDLANTLEGEFRVGHFTGMLSVVLKLLNLMQATHAYFGEKDYQQLRLVEKMVEAFFLDVKIVPCPTIREPSGLALSSRNTRLSENELKSSQIINQSLRLSPSADSAARLLQSQGLEVEYVTDKWDRRLAAVKVGAVRLIDNVPLSKVVGAACQ